MSTNGFVKIRNGIDEHLRAGTISLFEAGVLLQMTRQADYTTGVWFGDAHRLYRDAPRENSVDDCRSALKHLAQIGWVRSWRRGRRNKTNTYLINKFEATEGVAKGMWLNLDKTTDWKNPLFESIEDASQRRSVGVAVASQRRSNDVAKAGTSQDQEKNSDQKQSKRAGSVSASPSDDNSIGDKESISLCKYLQGKLRMGAYPTSWLEHAHALLGESTPDELRAVIDFVATDPYWTVEINGMENLRFRLNSEAERSLMNQYLAAKRKQELESQKQENSNVGRKTGDTKWD